jgi:hypothetical protein
MKPIDIRKITCMGFVKRAQLDALETAKLVNKLSWCSELPISEIHDTLPVKIIIEWQEKADNEDRSEN